MKVIDIYGEELKITLNKQPFVKSTLGGFMTILTILLILAAGYLIGKDIIYKEQPISFSQEDVSLTINPVKVSSNEEVQIAIEIQDLKNLKFYDETVLNYNLYLVEQTFSDIGTDIIDEKKLALKIKNCTYDDWTNKINRSDYDFLGLDEKLCLDFDHVELVGSPTEIKFKFLKFEVSRCISTEEVKCKDDKYINDIITREQLSLNIYTSYSSVDLINNRKPINGFIQHDKKYIVKDRHKEMQIEIVKGTVKTDDGFLFSHWIEESFFNLKFNQIDLKDRDANDMVLITYIFGASNLRLSYFRKYIKITDIFASLGGIIKSATLIFRLLNLTFAKIEKMKVITNEVFILKDDEKKINKKGKINLTTSQKLKHKIYSKPINLLNRNKIDRDLTTSIIPCDSPSKNTYTNCFRRGEIINIREIENEANKNYLEILNKLKNRKNLYRLSISLRDLFNILCYNRNRQYTRKLPDEIIFL